ncbi:LysR family transcriptional regulator [Rhizobiales bacterium]|uniref:LysR family transcriptional regulator n=1 Tax=Hongsoonwoonella zoysiae TaxID=2821844 RepID=UPI001561274E|nr:LysR family transcriptional regulator [Hongsoonwoonella zoysiae]NRG19294.1 LysR family transcriptional regulator [Hongsoonwoonella zoysiae]
MNWDDLRIFLAVARSGQILSAARRLGLNHATVSRRLGALEEALAVKLVDRRTTGCVLTPAGEKFLETAERVEGEMLAARAEIGEEDIAVTGTVRLGAPDGFGVAYLAPRLGELCMRHPDLTLQLVPVPRAVSLSRREADMAITVDRPEHGRLAARKLVDYELALFASRNYLASTGTPRTPAELKDNALVGYVEDLVYSATLAYADEIDRAFQPRFEIASSLGQTEAVRAGAGIGILHSFIARRDPNLIQVLPELTIRRTYWLVIHESVRELRRVRTVADFIVECVEKDRAHFR